MNYTLPDDCSLVCDCMAQALMNRTINCEDFRIESYAEVLNFDNLKKYIMNLQNIDSH